MRFKSGVLIFRPSTLRRRNERVRPARFSALLFGAAFFCAGLTPSLAADYFVEAVVFAWSDGAGSNVRERWKIGGRKPPEMPSAAKSPADNPALPSDRRLLDQSIAQLVQRGGASLLQHQAWTQLRAGRAGSPQVAFSNSSETQLSGWIRVYESTLLYAEVDLALFDENAISQIVSTISPGYQSNTGIAPADSRSSTVSNGTPTAGRNTPGVVSRDGVTVTTDANGNVSFSNQPGATGAVTAQSPTMYEDTSPGETYRINERRRIKFNEIHYIDHPKFGVLLTITRDEQS